MFQKIQACILVILTETMTSSLLGKAIFVTSSHRLSLEVPFSTLFNLHKTDYMKFILFSFWDQMVLSPVIYPFQRKAISKRDTDIFSKFSMSFEYSH